MDTATSGRPVLAGDFRRDSVLIEDPHRPGVYLGSIPDAWRVKYAFGGMSMAVALRGIESALQRDDLEILSANAVFCSPVSCGDVEVEARVLRQGRTAAQAVADLRMAGSDDVAIHASAIYGERVSVPIDYNDLVFPDDAGTPETSEVPPPRDENHPFPQIPFHDQTDWRIAVGTRWWEEEPNWTPGPARMASWTRLLNAPLDDEGRYDLLALCIPADSVGSAVGQRLGPDQEIHFFTVSLELGVQFFGRPCSPWTLQHLYAPVVTDSYAYGRVELFDENQQVCAIATQRAKLRLFTPGDGFFA